MLDKDIRTALVDLAPGRIDEIIEAAADAVQASADEIIAANKLDMARMPATNPMRDRLMLNRQRIDAMAGDMRNVAKLPSPLGHVLKEKTLENGLHLRRVSVPFGVIGVIYEARPNVTTDVFALCLKAGSACVLKGGSDAEATNKAIVGVLHGVLRQEGVSEAALTLLPATREATAALLDARGEVDLIIPRGSKGLIDFVRMNSKVPVIETGAGVCHTYFDADGDTAIGQACVHNGKTRRVSVCNALDCLIVHRDRLDDLPRLTEGLAEKNVVIYADREAYSRLKGYPYLELADEEHFGTEFMDYKMAVKTVGSILEATQHIARYGSGHSDSIVTESDDAKKFFQNRVDSACVYVNAPTSWTDGAQFGLGAEIGISTQKLHARGPMALEEICTYKWLIEGRGQTRP